MAVKIAKLGVTVYFLYIPYKALLLIDVIDVWLDIFIVGAAISYSCLDYSFSASFFFRNSISYTF